MKQNPKTIFSRAHRSLLTIALVQIPSLLSAAPPWGTPYGQPGIASVTCSARTSYAPAEAYVFGMMDLNAPPAPLYAANGTGSPMWNPPMHHEPSWTAENLGNLFGTEYDDSGNVYLAANGLYIQSYQGSFYLNYGALGGGTDSLAAAGTIYCIDATTGAPSVFAVLPQQATALTPNWNTGPRIGNLTYDKVHNQFFATNLEDGKIYPISSSGVVGTPFDPMTADDGEPGMPPAEERLWGIEMRGNQIYYAVWNTGLGTPASIRSVDLDGSGTIVPSTDVEVLAVPASSSRRIWAEQFVVVADIEFSQDDQTMLLGQRGLGPRFDTTLAAVNHPGKVYMAQLTGSTWSISNTLETGNNSWSVGETYGGVAYGPENGVQEALIWMSSADLATGDGPHGIQGTRPADFPVVSAIVSNSYRVPYDPSHTAADTDFDWKGVGGDIDVYPSSACSEFEILSVSCPKEIDSPYRVELNITNNSNAVASYARYALCPEDELPEGAFTAKPSSTVETFASPIDIGESAALSWDLYDIAPSGGTVCFVVVLLDAEGGECCRDKVCVDLPPCDCAELIEHSIECEVLPTGVAKYTLTLTVRNRTDFSSNPFDMVNATVLPPTGFGDPDDIVFSPSPLAPGDTGTVTLCYTGDPGLIQFTLALHDETFEECCFLNDIFLELPPCEDSSPFPDTSVVEARTACCPDESGRPSATIKFSVVNNSTEPRTYTWNANGFADPDCPVTLTASDFTPASGSLGPILPGECLTTQITIDCGGLAPEECAKYRVTATADPGAAPLVSEGEVYAPGPVALAIKFAPEDTGVDIVPVPVGSLVTVPFEVTNPGDFLAERLVSIHVPDILLPESSADFSSDRVDIPVTLEPGESQTVSLTFSRRDDGSRTPGFVQLLAFETDITFGTSVSVDAAAASVPLCLLPAEDKGEGEPVDDMFCLHSFTMEEPGVLRAEVTVISPSSIITIQRMIRGTAEWEDVPFSTRIPLVVLVDSFFVEEGPIDFYLSSDGLDSALFRVVCTPAPTGPSGPPPPAS